MPSAPTPATDESVAQDTPPLPVRSFSAKDLVKPLAETMPEITEPENAAPSESAPTPPPPPPTLPETPELPGMPPPDVVGHQPFGPSGFAVVGVRDPAIRDNRGTVFDSSLHAVDQLGNPRLNRKGNFISNRVGRPKGSTNRISDLDQPDAPNGSAPLISGPDIFAQTAEMYLQSGFGVLASFLSNEIKPETEEEHESLKIPLTQALREKGRIPFSSWQLFALAVAAHLSKKSTKPTVKERFTLIMIRVKSFFSRKPAQ